MKLAKNKSLGQHFKKDKSNAVYMSYMLARTDLFLGLGYDYYYGITMSFAHVVDIFVPKLGGAYYFYYYYLFCYNHYHY